MTLRKHIGRSQRGRRGLVQRAVVAALLLSPACLPEQYSPCRPEYASFDCKFQNGGRGAICIYDGTYSTMCAFPDADCETGYRWSEYAYRLSCECVAPERLMTDAGSGGER